MIRLRRELQADYTPAKFVGNLKNEDSICLRPIGMIGPIGDLRLTGRCEPESGGGEFLIAAQQTMFDQVVGHGALDRCGRTSEVVQPIDLAAVDIAMDFQRVTIGQGRQQAELISGECHAVKTTATQR